MRTLTLGELFTATYENPPVLPAQQFKIGDRVSIHDDDVLIGYFKVESTDSYNIIGKVIEVINTDDKPNT